MSMAGQDGYPIGLRVRESIRAATDRALARAAPDVRLEDELVGRVGARGGDVVPLRAPPPMPEHSARRDRDTGRDIEAALATFARVRDQWRGRGTIHTYKIARACEEAIEAFDRILSLDKPDVQAEFISREGTKVLATRRRELRRTYEAQEEERARLRAESEGPCLKVLPGAR
jgi:hypothetical protein